MPNIKVLENKETRWGKHKHTNGGSKGALIAAFVGHLLLPEFGVGTDMLIRFTLTPCDHLSAEPPQLHSFSPKTKARGASEYRYFLGFRKETLCVYIITYMTPPVTSGTVPTENPLIPTVCSKIQEYSE